MTKKILEFDISGMHCAACSARIERVLGKLPDVEQASVSLATDTAQVTLSPYADAEAAVPRIIQAVSVLGFSASLPAPSPSSTTGKDLPRSLDLAIGGMHCAACSARIERVAGNLPEVESISVSLASNTAHVVFTAEAEPGKASAALLAAISPLGFSAEIIPPANASGGLSETAERWEKRAREQREELAARKRDLIPGFTFALPLLVLSMGEMAGMPLPDMLNPLHSPFAFALLQLLLCLPVLWSGRRFFLQGIPALLRKAPNMDSLVALGTGAAFLFSLWNTMLLLFSAPPASVQQSPSGVWDALFGSGHSAHGLELYYESAAVVIALVSLGKYLESRSRLRTSETMKSLLDLAPETAVRIKDDGSEESVPLNAVVAGDRLRIRPGGRVPVDGVVLEGGSFVDESMLTGESMPVEKVPGDSLAGGTMNMQGGLVMRAERVGADTMLARIIRLVQEAQGSKAPIAGMADRISYYFVPVVICVAMLAGIFWWIHDGSTAFALRIFVSVMVIACPCAMGLATPMSIMVGTGRGAQLGVLFKNGLALEQSSRITAMVFDKTGTLTSGSPALVSQQDLSGLPDQDGRAERLLRIAASLERSSEHPLARALLQAAGEKGLTDFAVSNFTATPGKGVSGTVMTDKGTMEAAVGNALFIREQLAPEAAEGFTAIESLLAGHASRGETPVVLLLDGAPGAVFAVADPLRPESPATIAALAGMGIHCVMLTGDNAVTARAVADKAGIEEVIAGVLPDGKEQAVIALQRQGHVVGMVGDGINDAPALARADVGFAMNSGIDVAVETGDVILMRHGLESATTALALGRATMRNIRQNLFWAFAYNIIGIPFAAGLFHYFGGPTLSPMLAGAAMAMSSVSVVTNALRLRLFNAK